MLRILSRGQFISQLFNLTLDLPPKRESSYNVGTLQHRSQYPVVAAHSMLTKSTKPFVLGYSVIANMLLSSVPGKACSPVCSVALIAY